jgi:titin
MMASAPYTIPEYPVNLVTTAGNASVKIGFRPPSSDGGSVITNYQYSLNNGAWTDRTPASSSTPLMITGLTNGVNYSIRIRAVNAAGGGVASWPVSAMPMTTPGAPQGLSAQASHRSATMSFTHPAETGGVSITHYQWSLDGGQTWTVTTQASRSTPMLMQDLINGRTYQIRVRAINLAGAGPASNVATVMPCTTPDFPTNIRVEPGDRSALMYFTPPTQTGGAPILNYQYSINNGQTWLTRSPASSSSPILFSGLTNGTRYALKIRAVNAAGPGLESWTFTVFPRTVPGAPNITAVQPGNGMANLVIQAPSNTGGASLTNYEYSLDGGLQWRARWPAHAGSNLMISGLVNGLTYAVRVRAVNEAGPGDPSTTVNVRPRISGSKPAIQGSLVIDTARSYGNLRVFPNPVTDGKINLEMNGAGDFVTTIRLLTDEGKVVRIFRNQQWKGGKVMLDLGDIRGLKTGLLQWTTDQQTVTVRIIWKQ